MDAIETLSQMTYVVEHSPNCSLRFLVRLAGKGAGQIDKKPVKQTEDILGYGQTFEEAAFEALRKKGVVQCIPCIDGVSLCEPNKMPAGACTGCGG